MDDQKLAELFRAAAADAPPAAFDAQDVATASRRITARRRSVIAGGSALAGVVLVVGLVVGFVGVGHTGGNEMSAGSAGAGGSRAATADANHAQPMLPNEDFSAPTPKQGGGGDGKTGSNPAGCGPTDGQLAAALAHELPSVGAPAAIPDTITCPANTRAAAYQVTGGTVGVLLVPAGRTGLKVDPAVITSPQRAGSGATLIVFSQPAGTGTAPEVDHLAAIATALAPGF